ncbi:hypothetical protein GGQ74_002192 [Desulfobaculum xiamenense]|uniref:Holin of 3TMs, for gene-transfer release n=1 Tax=Desulfobaculum xiamenense TaxID=995050 RepID=A0A846QV45_9BACT|nr:hypothetical protein [Desulfobaculum xiamenense]NJB68519.1 hypothetical protein [Desulfobaculum xiamenense]
MADWKDVGRFIAGAAPILGGALGGPMGAVAGAAGQLVASFLGVEPEPDAVLAATADPQTLLRLRELEDRQRERLLDWRTRQLDAEERQEAERTRRHQADMASDSVLAKNVRPLCLLVFTAAIVGGTFMSEVPMEKLGALTDLGYGIYGYYFIGRSAFDKGAVRMNWGKR